MPAVKTQRWHELVAEAKVMGVEIDRRWSEAKLEQRLAAARPVARHVGELEGAEVPPPEDAEIIETTVEAPEAPVEATEEQKAAARASIIAKLRAMNVYYSDAMTTEALAATLEKKQREPLVASLARLGGHYNPDWTLDELREATIEAGKPIEAPEGFDLIHAAVKDPSQGVAIRSISRRRHALGDAAMQYIEFGQTALVPPDVARAFRDAGLAE